MYKVKLPGFSGLVVSCHKCLTNNYVAQNKSQFPSTMAFNHPEQRLFVTCSACGEQVEWTPTSVACVSETMARQVS